MMTSREKLGLALGFAGVVLFGGTLPATRLAVVSFDPFFLSAARAAIAGALGVIILIVTRRPWPPRQIMIELIITGVFTIIGFPVLIGFAMLTVPASHGGVVLGIMPLATAVCAIWLTHERPSTGFWIASTIGGVLVLVFVFWRAGGFAIEVGDLYLLGVVVVGALGYTMSGRLSAAMPGWEVISWQVAVFLPLTIAASLWWWPAPGIVPTPSAWAGLAYVSLISMFFAFFVFNAAMAYAGVSRIGQMSLLQPFVIVALSIPVNGEPFEPETILFAAAVVGTVMVGQRMRVKRAS
jgi:drug/metabolite transporter (DMT)-like permease